MPYFVFLAVAAGIIIPYGAAAGIVINEVLFDPTGIDTGLEKIEFYNPDAAPADMSGWELYPDGIGYFTFPSGFLLGAKSFAVVHLRASGRNDAVNSYHTLASSNMGNSSGSVALFKFGGRTKDTIADFTRYHKVGAAERKTWESTAADAGLWTTGTFVDISTLAEGNSIGLASDGVRVSAGSWKIYASASLGGANTPAVSNGDSEAGAGSAAAGTPPSPSQLSGTESSEGKPPPPPAPPPTRSLGADAGPDVTAAAGTVVQFRGNAFGFDGEALDQARFLWNFGDGALAEGRSLIHIYHFPGTYRANLTVSSGSYTGSAWRRLSVVAPRISVVEVKPGPDGFIELANSGTADVDLSGLALLDDRSAQFRIPPGTLAFAGGVMVLPNAVTKLDPISWLVLRDARGAALDSAQFSSILPDGASWERASDRFVIQLVPTPGVFNERTPSSPSQLSEGKLGGQAPPPSVAMAAPPPAPPSPEATEGTASPPLPSEAPEGAKEGPAAPLAVAAAAGLPRRLFLAASALLGVASAIGIILLKRMAP